MKPKKAKTDAAANARREIILNEKKEAEAMNAFTFTADTMTAKGKTFPVEYSISTDSVTVFAKVDETGTPARIRFDAKHPDYPAARAAAEEAAAAWKARRNGESAAARPETISATPGKAEKPPKKAAEKKTEKPAPARPENISEPAAAETFSDEKTAVKDPAPAAVSSIPAPETTNTGKATRGPIPEKTFIGETITGKGWKIIFDGAEGRTRVLFDKDPTEAARAELDAARFFYSPSMNSWNKKLTFKAHRAAQALAAKLAAIYA